MHSLHDSSSQLLSQTVFFSELSKILLHPESLPESISPSPSLSSPSLHSRITKNSTELLALPVELPSWKFFVPEIFKLPPEEPTTSELLLILKLTTQKDSSKVHSPVQLIFPELYPKLIQVIPPRSLKSHSSKPPILLSPQKLGFSTVNVPALVALAIVNRKVIKKIARVPLILSNRNTNLPS